MNFTKMHGIGNDFILIEGRANELDAMDLPKLAEKLCDRNFGIGADGLIAVLSSKTADVKMRIFNPDGTEPEMCGNGVRCFAKYVWEKMETKKDLLSVETLAGTILPSIIEHKGKIAIVEVDMGIPKDIKNIKIKEYDATSVSMGNPHCVIFVDDTNKIALDQVGPEIENDALFPNKTNVEFVEIKSKKEIIIRVWERGAGETLACGTGACASVAAGINAGTLDRDVLVRLPGGNLDIEWGDDEHIVLRGPAETVFEGTI